MLNIFLKLKIIFQKLFTMTSKTKLGRNKYDYSESYKTLKAEEKNLLKGGIASIHRFKYLILSNSQFP